MRAEAIVISTSDNMARVKCVRQSACASCQNCESNGHCHAQLIFGESEQSVELDVYNKLGAKKGDRVMLSSTGASILLFAICVFVVPVALSILAYVVAENLFCVSYAPVISLVSTFVLFFLICTLICDRYAKKKLRTEIVKIIEESGNVVFSADDDDKEN